MDHITDEDIALYCRFVLWFLVAVILATVLFSITACSTAPATPGAPVTDIQVRLNQANILLATARGVFDGEEAAGDLTKERADQLRGYLKSAEDAISLANTTLTGTGGIQCFVNTTCTDEQTQEAAAQIAKAITLLIKVTG